jgi:hypothetical protein
VLDVQDRDAEGIDSVGVWRVHDHIDHREPRLLLNLRQHGSEHIQGHSLIFALEASNFRPRVAGCGTVVCGIVMIQGRGASPSR